MNYAQYAITFWISQFTALYVVPNIYNNISIIIRIWAHDSDRRSTASLIKSSKFSLEHNGKERLKYVSAIIIWQTTKNFEKLYLSI